MFPVSAATSFEDKVHLNANPEQIRQAYCRAVCPFCKDIRMEAWKSRTWYLVVIIKFKVRTRVSCLELHAFSRLTLSGTVLSADQSVLFGESGDFTIL